MSQRILPVVALILACGWSMPAHGHGKERLFGTPINSRSSTPEADEGRGAPAFTLLALSATLRAVERDLGGGRRSEVRERARRLQGMARDLVARSSSLGALEREQIGLAARLIAESAERIDSAAASSEAEEVLREVASVRWQIAALEDLLRNAEN